MQSGFTLHINENYFSFQASSGQISGLICRTTAIPQEKDVLYANPVVLADQLIGVTDDPLAIVDGVNISAAPIGECE